MKFQAFYQDIMNQYLRPNLIYESVFDVDFDLLHDDGIRYLFFDLDNTLISFAEKEISLQCLNLFNSISKIGFDHIFLVSNNSSVERVTSVCKQLNLPGVSFACKPFVFTMRRLLNQYNMDAHQCAFFGDQLFTDILLANTLKLTSVFIEPINSTHVSFFRSIQYRIQQSILNSF